jgi:hypothetical protein
MDLSMVILLAARRRDVPRLEHAGDEQRCIPFNTAQQPVIPLNW